MNGLLICATFVAGLSLIFRPLLSRYIEVAYGLLFVEIALVSFWLESASR